MAKKRKNKKAKRRIAIFGTLSVVAIAYCLFTLCYYSYRITVLEKSKKDLEEQLVTLKKNEEILNSDIQKFKDPEYIAKFARENYMYSKDGEYIIKIESDDIVEQKDSNSVDYKYYIFIGSAGLLIILLYIIKRNNENKKRS